MKDNLKKLNIFAYAVIIIYVSSCSSPHSPGQTLVLKSTSLGVEDSKALPLKYIGDNPPTPGFSWSGDSNTPLTVKPYYVLVFVKEDEVSKVVSPLAYAYTNSDNNLKENSLKKINTALKIQSGTYKYLLFCLANPNNILSSINDILGKSMDQLIKTNLNKIYAYSNIITVMVK